MFPVANLSGQVQFVLLCIHAKLLPHIEQKIDGILGMHTVEGVEESESVLLKSENLQFLVVEIAK